MELLHNLENAKHYLLKSNAMGGIIKRSLEMVWYKYSISILIKNIRMRMPPAVIFLNNIYIFLFM